MNIHELMERAAANDASDLHITVGLPYMASARPYSLCDQIVTSEMSEHLPAIL